MDTARDERAHRIAEHYVAGATLEEAGRLEGVSPMTAMRDLKALGIERRKPDPAPKERQCERIIDPETGERCPNIFTPTRRQLEQGYGRFCSNECDGAAHRIYAKPQERQCGYTEGPLGVHFFTPDADKGWQDARGFNVYCSNACKHAAQRGARQHSTKGEWITCDNCGREAWRYDCELAIDHPEGNFCSYECHAEHRKRYPWPGYRNFLSPAASGRARQRVIGAREGRAAGRKGGKTRGYTELQARGVRQLREADPSLGIRRLARETGLTEWQVRMIVAAAA